TASVDADGDGYPDSWNVGATAVEIAASALVLDLFPNDSTQWADTVSPVIALLGANPLTVAQGGIFTDPGTTVIDNVDIGLVATATGVVDTYTVGNYTINYNVSDIAGNAATSVSRTANVTVAISDTDGDGIADMQDAFPADPYQSIAPDPYSIVMGDLNVNGSNEIAVLQFNKANGRWGADIIDPLNANIISSINFGSLYTPVMGMNPLLHIPDVNADGIDEIALLGKDGFTGRTYVLVKNALTGATISNVVFTKVLRQLGALVLPDLNGNGVAEIGVLEENVGNGNKRLRVRDISTGKVVGQIALPATFTYLAMDVIPTAVPKVAILARNSAGGIKVLIYKPQTGVEIKRISYVASYIPKGLTILYGGSQIGVLGKDGVTGKVKLQLRSFSTGAAIRDIGYPAQFPPTNSKSMLEMPDLNANGSPDIAVLGSDAAGNVRVIIKDANTKQLIKVITYTQGIKPLQLIATGDLNGNGVPDIAVLHHDVVAGTYNLEIRDELSGAVISTVTLPSVQ
ncbi:MAG: DUF5011 domain-containing protein, partial [Mariprofundales bacterium]